MLLSAEMFLKWLFDLSLEPQSAGAWFAWVVKVAIVTGLGSVLLMLVTDLPLLVASFRNAEVPRPAFRPRWTIRSLLALAAFLIAAYVFVGQYYAAQRN